MMIVIIFRSSHRSPRSVKIPNSVRYAYLSGLLLDVVVLYHERWEEELTIDELKTHQRERPVLRSQTPAGVVQEI